jgi:UDP-3-O-[3-hydroxymyristoyl] glucosamine N-acyltransferase
MAGHITIGMGAQIGGASHPIKNVAAGERMGGTPAMTVTEWGRQLAALRRLTQREKRSGGE